ncbi:MAG: DNA polymerase III subunit delta [Acidobacteria bacterium]|nr:DNA polymerase III subunit delta [Acidobacteriota bacterium]
MTRSDLEAQLQRGKVPPVALFIGPDAYSRRRVKDLMVAAVGGETTRFDLDEISLASVIDDASSLSLFATERLIWVTSAEAALPKRLTAKEDDDGPVSPLAAYVRNPTPGTVLVLDCSRYGFEGDDKAKVDRVRKFYAAVPTVVEFPPFSDQEAAQLVRESAARQGLKLSGAQVEMLVEALGADAARITTEVEKLALFAPGRALTDAELGTLIPNARTASLFSLVNALARSDRRTSLDLLDVMVREGEYLPLVLTFLGTQFRLALVAAEAGLRGAGQIQGHFQKLGVAMWRSRAEQLADTLTAFTPQRLRRAIQLTFEADRALRDTRPDDRTAMERFVWDLTAKA